MLLPFLLYIAACLLVPANSEVVPNFNKCPQFFLDGKSPGDSLKPLNPARICQSYNDKYHFATMYDRDKRIPIYSAYKYNPGKPWREDEWKVEPQLALPRGTKSMEQESTTTIERDLLEMSQAVSSDYASAIGYDRGHLNPVSHLHDPDSKAATFTLTNIVPQFGKLNKGTWANYEAGMGHRAGGCRDMYVIVGVVPGEKYTSKPTLRSRSMVSKPKLMSRSRSRSMFRPMSRPMSKPKPKPTPKPQPQPMHNRMPKPKGRVNIPSHIWAAGCCADNRNPWAVIAENNRDAVHDLTLVQLENRLAELYRTRKVDLFNGSC